MALISQYQVVIPGQSITAALWNAMELNIINNGLIPGGIEDYSATDSQMQTATDPFPGSAISKPTSLAGELERIRWQFDNIIGGTYWYEDPPVDITTFKTRFDAHTHDGTSNNGPQIQAGGLASDAVTTAKILDGNVTTAKIADANVTLGKLASNSVDENKIVSTTLNSNLTGGSGTKLDISSTFTLSNRCFVSVYLANIQNNVTGDGTVFKIPFNASVVNRGSAFDTGSTYTFTAPVTGVYLISYSVRYYSATGVNFMTTLVTTPKSYDAQQNIGLLASATITDTLLCYLTAGQTAYVNAYADGGTKESDIHADKTRFFAALLF